MRKTKIFFTLLSVLILQPVWSGDPVINPWQALSSSAVMSRQSTVDQSERNVLVSEGRRLSADLPTFAAELNADGGIVVSLPLPGGDLVNYRFSKSTTMADTLAEKYPEIQTFTAQDVDNPNNKGSFDVTPQGFHGMFKHDGQWVFIDPEMRNDTGSYIAYFSKNAQALTSREADKVLNFVSDQTVTADKSIFSSRPVLGETLRTYRIAISASAEYTAFHGGTVSKGLAAITTMVNRLNEVYQRDLSVRFELVANNDDVIYTNSRLDPFSNTSADASENKAVLNGVIGVDNYDIGHVVNTGGGGEAYLGSICDKDYKSYGVTGTNSPTGDAFYIDYVAHEIGHQLGANHTFNGTNSNCGGANRNAATAWEPGSGSTIMGYAGICGTQSLQAYSDAFFHSGSIEEMLTTIESASCGTSTAVTNAVPTVDAGSDYTIPSNTPFKLIGSAKDTNSDPLSYSWDEYDTGAASRNFSEMIDNGNRPLFRSWDLTDTAERYFPRLQDVLVGRGYTTIGESYPTTDRDLTFRLTVRDGKGGVATDETIITVKAAVGPFQVTEPTASSFWKAGEQALIRWDVAETDQAPVNCSEVSILLSTNGGSGFKTTLVASTPNDGEHELTVSDLGSNQAKVMVSCVGNVFLAVSEGEFSISDSSGSSAVDPVDEPASETDVVTSNKSGGGVFDPLLIFLLLLSFRKKQED